MVETSLRPRLRPAGLDTSGSEPAEPATKAGKLATVNAPIDLDGLMLVGVFGKEDALEALVRLPGGKIRKVAPGGKLRGYRVAAIAADRVILQTPGGNRTLRFPDRARGVPAA